jgi:GTPase SAR1 family protein
MADALAKALQDQGCHPVLVFGPSSSGKTTLLLSMLDYLRRGSHGVVDVRLGEQVLPDDYPQAGERRSNAAKLFSNSLLDYQKNIAPERTVLELPFLVPVDLRHKEGEVSGSKYPDLVRLVFVEGMGEWYELDRQSGISRSPPFKEDIAEILRHYDKGISVIFVAPTISADIKYGNPLNQRNVAEIDAALSDTINEYAEVRLDKSNDHELFLLSKWDTKFGDKIIGGKFTGTMEDDVYSHIHSFDDGAYRNAWTKFSGRPQRDCGTLSVMPHFAGRIPYKDPPLPVAVVSSNIRTDLGGPGSDANLPAEAKSRQPAVEAPRRTFDNTPELRVAKDHFNRVFANWLYGNATASLNGQRLELFPDMAISENKLLRWYEYAIYSVVGGRRSNTSPG